MVIQNYNAICSLVLLVSMMCASSSVCDEPSRIPKDFSVGAILPLSGDAATLGEAARNGIELAREDVELKFGSTLKIVIEDDGLSAPRALSALNKLLSIDKVDALICWSSGTCKAMAPVAEKARVPMLAIASDSSISRGRRFVFNLWVTPEEETRTLIPYVLGRGIKTVAMVTTIQDGALAVSEVFRDQSRGKINIVFDETYPPDMKDFKSNVLRLQQRGGVDAILVNLMPGQLGIFTKQLRQAGLKSQLFGYETLENREEVVASDNALLGAFFVTAGTGDSSFHARYQARYPKASAVTANNAYDAVSLLVETARKNSSPDAIAYHLGSVQNFPGASGVFSSTGDNRYLLPACIKAITPLGFSAQ